MPLRYILGNKVLELRERLGLSQEEFRATIGVSEPTLISIEKGRRPTNIDVLERIAKQLDVHPAVLLGGIDPTKAQQSKASNKEPVQALSPERAELLALLATFNDNEIRAFVYPALTTLLHSLRRNIQEILRDSTAAPEELPSSQVGRKRGSGLK